MLKWYKKLYIGTNMKGEHKKYIKKIKKKQFTFDIYLLTLAFNEVDQIDIFSANLLLQRPLRRRCPLIIGIARGYEDALLLFTELANDVYQETGRLELKTYIKEH